LFASEDLNANKTQNMVFSAKSLDISNRIFKDIVTPYLTIIDAFYLYCTCQHFFILFGGNYFSEWLKANQEILQFLYKTVQSNKTRKFVSLNKCYFTLQFPPGILLDENDLRIPRAEDCYFEFQIVGSVDPYGTAYLKPINQDSNLYEKPKMRRSTNCQTPLIIVLMDKEGNFNYRSRQNAILSTETGLMMKFKFAQYFGKIEIYDGTGTTSFGYLNKNTIGVHYSFACPSRFPKNIHVNFPHSNYFKEEKTTNSTKTFL